MRFLTRFLRRSKMANQDKRPWLVECPTCDAPMNAPCKSVLAGSDCAVPHDKRYRAAGIDPYSGQPTAGPPK
jgi:hypothetical protein